MPPLIRVHPPAVVPRQAVVTMCHRNPCLMGRQPAGSQDRKQPRQGKATFGTALKVLQCSKTIMSYDPPQCVLLALSVCALGRGLTEKVLGLGQRREGGGVPPPTAPQTVEHPSGSHIGWRRPPVQQFCFNFKPFVTCP